MEDNFNLNGLLEQLEDCEGKGEDLKMLLLQMKCMSLTLEHLLCLQKGMVLELEHLLAEKEQG